jgi:hypothetical protein
MQNALPRDDGRGDSEAESIRRCAFCDKRIDAWLGAPLWVPNAGMRWPLCSLWCAVNFEAASGKTLFGSNPAAADTTPTTQPVAQVQPERYRSTLGQSTKVGNIEGESSIAEAIAAPPKPKS